MIYKKGAAEILRFAADSVKADDGSVNPRELCCAVGALAGYACYTDVFNGFVRDKRLGEDTVFRIIYDNDGKKYYFGELLDNLLAGDKYSLWGFIGSAVKGGGGKLPDIQDILRYISFSAGKEIFGRVRSCELVLQPCGYTEKLWSHAKKIALGHCKDTQLHDVFGLCAAQAVMKCGGVFNITECGRIALESGIIAARSGIKR